MLARSRPQKAAIADGIVEVPPGKIAAVATYLEMGRPETPRPPAPLPGRLEPIGRDVARYRRLYNAVGEPWLWFSRAVLPDAKLAAILAEPGIEPYAFVTGGRDGGLVELDYREAPDCELAFFGLVPSLTGRGIGPALMAEAIRRAFLKPARRLWLHTCTLDHPAAMPFYLRSGFRAFRRSVEIADDPRLAGHMARGAAPHYPIV